MFFRLLKNNFIAAGAKGWFLFLYIVPALMMAVLSGCSSSNHGRLQSSHEVTQVFKNNQILSDHQYYSSGFQRIPYGIIGIANKYKLRSNRWKPINLNPTLLDTDGDRIPDYLDQDSDNDGYNDDDVAAFAQPTLDEGPCRVVQPSHARPFTTDPCATRDDRGDRVGGERLLLLNSLTRRGLPCGVRE